MPRQLGRGGQWRGHRAHKRFSSRNGGRGDGSGRIWPTMRSPDDHPRASAGSCGPPLTRDGKKAGSTDSVTEWYSQVVLNIYRFGIDPTNLRLIRRIFDSSDQFQFGRPTRSVTLGCNSGGLADHPVSPPCVWPQLPCCLDAYVHLHMRDDCPHSACTEESELLGRAPCFSFSPRPVQQADRKKSFLILTLRDRSHRIPSSPVLAVTAHRYADDSHGSFRLAMCQWSHAVCSSPRHRLVVHLWTHAHTMVVSGSGVFKRSFPQAYPRVFDSGIYPNA